MRQLTNPMAAPALAGLPPNVPDGFTDVDFTYPYDVSLAGGQALTNEQRSIDTDSEFWWRDTILLKATGAFTYKFSDSSGYVMSSGQIHSANLSANPSSPAPVFPEHPLPPGGALNIEITDISGNTNDIQIAFKGVKRYRRAKAA